MNTEWNNYPSLAAKAANSQSIEKIETFLGWSVDDEALLRGIPAQEVHFERVKISTLAAPKRISTLLRKYKRLNTASVSEISKLLGYGSLAIILSIEAGEIPGTLWGDGQQYRIPVLRTKDYVSIRADAQPVQA